MEFVEAVPVAFKEITPSYKLPEKWKEVILNTGIHFHSASPARGTHSTLQDIKLPQKAGGYWYKESLKSNTRNRFIYWQTTPDSIEFFEASLDINLSAANLRCKVAPGTPPLNGITVWERPALREVVILVATVSSVHRLVFPHPDDLDKKETFGSIKGTTPSIFYDTSSVNNANNYHILQQYSNTSTGVAHTCASLLRECGTAVFALAYGSGGDGGLLLVKLPANEPAITYQLKRDSTVPRFLSGLTGALRGKSVSEGLETYGVVILNSWVLALNGSACLVAWSLHDGGAPAALSQPLSQAQARPKPAPHGHMLQKATGIDGTPLLVAFLSFPNECEFVVIKLHDVSAGALKFTTICRVFGPQLDLLDYAVGFGNGTNVIWALWSLPDGETLITSTSIGAEVSWRSVAGRQPPPTLPQLPSHQHYQERLLAVGLFPPPVIRKALVIYRRTWGGGAGADVPADSTLGDAASSAVRTRMQHLAARSTSADHAHLMHRCWSDLYSWCLQYMEGLQKPLGIMLSQHDAQRDDGWWCAVVRRAGISFVKELEPLERIMLSPDCEVPDGGGSISSDAARVVTAGAVWERGATRSGADELERRVFACAAPQHRLLPRLLHLHTHPDPLLNPQQIEELISILEPIRDLHSAVLELNDALRLDVPDIDLTDDDKECSEYDNLLSSELGVAVVTEAIRQMAEIRARIVRGCVAAAGVARGAGAVPGAGHCAVHWQAYRALAALHAATHTHHPSRGAVGEELFRLKISSIGLAPRAADVRAGGVRAYARGAGGARARRQLARARAAAAWTHAVPLVAYHVAHQLWAVSGGFEFGCWLATINQPKLIQNYVSMLEPWCEWNACSRQFILGLALLDLEDTEGAYTAFCKAAKGVSTEPFLRQLVEASGNITTQHQALVLYYMKVINLFEIHDAGACVVRLAETAISIADKDDPNLGMFQWVVFKWHVAAGEWERALSAAAAARSPTARAAAAAALLTALAERGSLGILVTCKAVAQEAERAAASRARLHDALGHNPYYDFLYALHVHRQEYRKAAGVMYERAARCGAEGGGAATARHDAGTARHDAGTARLDAAHTARRRCLAAALTALRLAPPQHAFLVRSHHHEPQVIGIDELAAELREEDPDAIGPVQRALMNNESIDLNSLYPYLMKSDRETLLGVTKRVLNSGLAFPYWFLERYMEVDTNSCIRSLLAGGRAVEATQVCCEAFRQTLRHLTATSGGNNRPAPLAVADLLTFELKEHLHDPLVNQVYEELQQLIKQYMAVVARTSDDMKLAKIQFPIAS